MAPAPEAQTPGCGILTERCCTCSEHCQPIGGQTIIVACHAVADKSKLLYYTTHWHSSTLCSMLNNMPVQIQTLQTVALSLVSLDAMTQKNMQLQSAHLNTVHHRG